MERPILIYQVGAGGTGGYLIPLLSKVVNRAYDISNMKISYVVADGDIVEQKNIERQNFLNEDIGKYKVNVFGKKYGIIGRPKYIYSYENIVHELMFSYIPFQFGFNMNNPYENIFEINKLLHEIYKGYNNMGNMKEKYQYFLFRTALKFQYIDLILIGCVDKVNIRMEIAHWLRDFYLMRVINRNHTNWDFTIPVISRKYGTINFSHMYYELMIFLTFVIKNVWYIDAGNGAKLGQAESLYVPENIFKEQEEEEGNPFDMISKFYDDMNEVIDEDEDRVSCADIVEQTSLMNMQAASVLLAMVTDFLENDKIFLKSKSFSKYNSMVEYNKF
jgi:hypothetical protein